MHFTSYDPYAALGAIPVVGKGLRRLGAHPRHTSSGGLHTSTHG